jgi:anti-anti-sigma factor
MMAEFALRLTQNSLGAVVLLAGELDQAAAPAVRECVEGLVGEYVTLDFSDVTFLDSIVIGVLVAAYSRTLDAGGTLVFHNVPRPQMKLFQEADLTEYLKFDDGSSASRASVDRVLHFFYGPKDAPMVREDDGIERAATASEIRKQFPDTRRWPSIPATLESDSTNS